MAERIHPTWQLRDQMGRELMDKITSHPETGPWQEGFPATSLMLNSASHPDVSEALKMVVEDVVNAERRNAPSEIVKFALQQVIEFRNVLYDTQARIDEPVTGKISVKDLKNELRKKVSSNYLKDLF